MKTKENQIAKFSQNKTKIELIEIKEKHIAEKSINDYYITKKYQIRINRKRVYSNTLEYETRKHFASYVQNTILQLKIY